MHLTDSTFESMFKLTRAGFEDLLLEIISPFMHDTNEHMAVSSSGSVVSNKENEVACYFAVVLCYRCWSVENQHFSQIFLEKSVIDAIDAAFVIGYRQEVCL